MLKPLLWLHAWWQRRGTRQLSGSGRCRCTPRHNSRQRHLRHLCRLCCLVGIHVVHGPLHSHGATVKRDLAAQLQGGGCHLGGSELDERIAPLNVSVDGHNGLHARDVGARERRHEGAVEDCPQLVLRHLHAGARRAGPHTVQRLVRDEHGAPAVG